MRIIARFGHVMNYKIKLTVACQIYTYVFHSISDKYYFEVDRMYGDLKDSFVYAQAM